MKKFKGQLIGFPEEVVNKMLDYQVKQGNKHDVTVFEDNSCSGKEDGGFRWRETPEGIKFWSRVISSRNFDLFFQQFPKVEEKSYEQKVLNILGRYISGDRTEELTNDILSAINERITDMLPNGLEGNLIGLGIDVTKKQPIKRKYTAIFSDQETIEVSTTTPYQAFMVASAKRIEKDEEFTIEVVIDEDGRHFKIDRFMDVVQVNNN
jgi:hypothetical protein